MSEIEVDQLVVCLVEPSHVQCRIITDYLESLGITDIQECSTGKDALSIISVQKPDLVISAMYLSDMTGTDLVYTIREDRSLDDTAFALLSSETQISLLEPIRQAGAIAIVPKPCGKEDIEEALRSTIEYFSEHDLETDAEVDVDSIKVLSVDDSKFSRKYVYRVLEGMGIQNVDEAEDGRGAVELLDSNFYDLVITDFNMPGLRGDELVRYIREESTQPSIPILMLTSEQSPEKLAKISSISSNGVSAISDKPFNPAHIRSLVEHLLTE